MKQGSLDDSYGKRIKRAGGYAMTSRERVFTAMGMETPDRPPVSARFHAGFLRIFNEKAGANLPHKYLQLGHPGFIAEPLPGSISPEEYFGCDIRQVTTLPGSRPNDYSQYFEPLTDRALMNEWGVVHRFDPQTFSERRIGPLRHLTSTHEIARYPLPDVDADYRWQGLVERLDRFKKEGCATAGFLHATFFELLCDLRGYEQFLTDLYTQPALAEALISHVTDLRIRQAVGLARSGVELLRVGDNFGIQNQMLISPEKWRKAFKPGLEKLIQSVKSIRPDLILVYKSDGYIEPIIPDLIDIGVDILCPIQAESMDAVKIKKQFGRRLGIWGTVSTQTLLPFGTPQQVKDKVSENMRVLGKGGGFIIGPDQILLPDVPWDNVMAFFEAVQSFRW
jgi:uroporphyrinogen decarboxylase